VRKISNEFYQGELTVTIFLLIFDNIASKLEKIGPIFSSFNPFPSLPTVATTTGSSFSSVRKSLITKVDPYFWNSIEAKTLFSF